MARNCEKNYGRLNRLWLEKGEVKAEKRPKLSALKTSDEISYWLPSIKNELDFVLKQTEVPCYTEQKIRECRKRIHYLESEYKAFVRKLHKVDATLKTTPWTARPYEKRNTGRKQISTRTVTHSGKAKKKNARKTEIPMLYHDGTRNIPVLHPVDTELASQCLKPLETPVLLQDQLYEDEICEKEKNSDCTNSAVNDEKPLEFRNMRVSKKFSPSSSKGPLPAPAPSAGLSRNVLGLDYGSSSDEDS